MWGSWVCIAINIIALAASFYVALFPIGGPNLNAESFFISYLAGPLLVFLYFCWKIYSWFVYPSHRPLWVAIKDIDIYTGMRDAQAAISGPNVPEDQRRASLAEIQQGKRQKGFKDYLMDGVHTVF